MECICFISGDELAVARDRKRAADPFAHVQQYRGRHRRARRGHRVREEDVQRTMCGVREGICRCHNYIGLGPSLISIYGSRAAQQKQFGRYSNKTLCMRQHRWSKQRLFTMLGTPPNTKITPNPSSESSQRCLWTVSRTPTCVPPSSSTCSSCG